MRKISLLVFFIVQFLAGVNELQAQPNSLYFLKGTPQTRDLNPARPGLERGYYFSMPLLSKLDLSFNTNNWSYNDLIHRGTGAMADSLVWDFKNFLSSIGKKNFVNESAALTLFDFGWTREENFFGFSWSEHEFAEAFFTRDLINILYTGNASSLGSTYRSGYLGVGAQHYRQFAFNFSREMSRKMRVGVTGKLLFGMSAIQTSGLNAVAGMPASGDQIDLAAAGKASISGPTDIQIINKNGYKVLTQSYFNAGKYLSNFGNPGFAVDLGFSAKLNKKFELSVSLIDLGFIKWNRDVSTFTENGHFMLRGINLDEPANRPPTTTDLHGLLIAFRDSLHGAFYPLKSTAGFSTLLPVKLYLAGEYRAKENITLGGVARVRLLNNLIHTSFTASVNDVLSEKFNVSASYSIMESTFTNIGLAAAYRMKRLQLYAATDNVISFYRPPSASNLNLRFGINLIFQDDPNQIKGMYQGGRR